MPSGCSPTRNGCWSCSAPRAPRRADRTSAGRRWAGRGAGVERHPGDPLPPRHQRRPPRRSGRRSQPRRVRGAARRRHPRLLADWLRRTDRVTVRPVLDPTRISPVDRHDPPEVMREAVILRDGHCVFPGCTVDARSCDLDHIDPYVPPNDGGPPGQTNLAQPRLPLPATPPPQDLHRLDLPARTRRQLRVGQPPRHHLHRQPRPRTLNAADPATRPTREPRAGASVPSDRKLAARARNGLDRERFLFDGPACPLSWWGSRLPLRQGHTRRSRDAGSFSDCCVPRRRGAPTLRGARPRPGAAPDRTTSGSLRSMLARRAVGQELADAGPRNRPRPPELPVRRALTGCVPVL